MAKIAKRIGVGADTSPTIQVIAVTKADTAKIKQIISSIIFTSEYLLFISGFLISVL
ncbi:hypothetical protein GM3709_571 [Geminocystis sp. NIES-3709]|nr:hypothetical protein GM3709_571 [Geminocystis sp. NIES-3709]